MRGGSLKGQRFISKLLGEVLRIFMDTVASWYRERQADRGLPVGEGGAVAVIQRANSDLRLNPHVHVIFLDGLYAPDGDGKGWMFHPAPGPGQHDIEQVVQRTSKRILRFLHVGIPRPIAERRHTEPVIQGTGYVRTR